MKKVLIVEDDVAMQNVIAKELGSEYEVRSVSEGNAAITQSNIFQPSVILLDLDLIGEMDGVAILDLIRDNDFTSTIPVVVYTNSGKNRKDELYEHGANEYLTKSGTDISEIATVIKKYASIPPIPAEKKDV